MASALASEGFPLNKRHPCFGLPFSLRSACRAQSTPALRTDALPARVRDAPLRGVDSIPGRAVVPFQRFFPVARQWVATAHPLGKLIPHPVVFLIWRTFVLIMWQIHACRRLSAIPQASRELALQPSELLRLHLEKERPLRAVASEGLIPYRTAFSWAQA